jgi:hypothetical protein
LPGKILGERLLVSFFQRVFLFGDILPEPGETVGVFLWVIDPAQ